jgi:hypothetical protein
MERKCLDCGDLIHGRIDKKFCNDQCRNSYNNKDKSSDNNYMRNVNSILRKNRKILVKLNPNDKAKANKEKMLAAGFNFSYYTNTYITKDNRVYYYVYDYAYQETGEDWYLIVKKKDWD